MSRPRPKRHVLLIAFREDRLDSRTWRFPLWGVRLAVAGVVALGLLALLGLAFYGPLVRTAARVPGLSREVERLRLENERVGELALALDSVEAGYARLRQMVGADLAPLPALPGQQPLVAAAIAASAPGIAAFVRDTMLPAYWPLDEQGYITRGSTDTLGAADELHPGLDIAVRVGSLVRATAAGTVLEAGQARDYGLYVLLRHDGGYESMYGHLSRITVERGEVVSAGAVIGLSGNTGRSTAPHLHFEIRRDGRSVDPATLVKEVS